MDSLGSDCERLKFTITCHAKHPSLHGAVTGTFKIVLLNFLGKINSHH